MLRAIRPTFKIGFADRKLWLSHGFDAEGLSTQGGQTNGLIIAACLK